MSTIYLTSIYPNADSQHWTHYSIEKWKNYCQRYGLEFVLNDTKNNAVFPGKPLHFQKFSAFTENLMGDVLIVDADSLPMPNAPNIFDVHTDPAGIYTWYDPGLDNKPITNTHVKALSPSSNALNRSGILRLKDIEGEDCSNPNNWFHVCAGLILFKEQAYQTFANHVSRILRTRTKAYCRDESVFSYWISHFYRQGTINIHRLDDLWFNMPAFTRAGRYDFGPIEHAWSVQYVHCKEEIIKQCKAWEFDGSNGP